MTHNEQFTTRRQRRDAHLLRAHAVGNTTLEPTYRELYDGRGTVKARVYLGHRPGFQKRFRSPLLDNVSRIRLGDDVSDDVAAALVTALRVARAGRPT